MTSESRTILGTTDSPTPSNPWLWLVPVAILAWWIRDLSYHWASLVEYRFGWLMVVLAGFLVWERWPTRPPTRPEKWSLRIAALAGAGFSLVFFGELYRIGVSRAPIQVFPLSVGCACFLYSCLLLIGGSSFAAHLRFPLLFFFVGVPIPKSVWQPIVSTLQELVAVLNVESLQVLGISAIRHGHVIQLPNTWVGVDEACSGIRSLQSTIMATLFIGDLTLKRWRSRVILLGCAVVLAVVGNWGRSLYLALEAHRGGSSALDLVHDSAGWTVLLFTATGVIILSWGIGRIEKFAEYMQRARAQG